MRIVLDDVESNDAASEVDLTDFRIDSITQDTDTFSPEAGSKAATPFNLFPSCHSDPDSVTNGPCKLNETVIEMEIIETENGHKHLECKVGKARRHNQGGC